MNTQQDTQKQSSHTSRPRFRRAAFAAGVSVAAFVAAGSMTSATAMHPVEDSPSGAPPSSNATVTTPCFDVPTPDRWNGDPMPRCTHTFGAATAFASEASGPDAATVDSPPFMNGQRWRCAVDGAAVCTTQP